MAETFKDKVEEAGHKISETATKVGHDVSEKFEEATDWAKEKAHSVGHRIDEAVQKAEHKTGLSFGSDSRTSAVAADIQDHQDVYASCGTKIGRVDHVEGDVIKLTKNDSPDGRHHLIPLSWVAKVHDHIHLNKNSSEVKSQWQTV